MAGAAGRILFDRQRTQMVLLPKRSNTSILVESRSGARCSLSAIRVWKVDTLQICCYDAEIVRNNFGSTDYAILDTTTNAGQ